MDAVALYDWIAALGFGLSLPLLWRARCAAIDLAARIFLSAALFVCLLFSIANGLEHSNITALFDPFEDYLGILFAPFFLFFIFACRSRRALLESRHAEAVSRQNETRFRTLFELSPQPILLTDLASGEILSVNDAFCASSGFPRDQLVGRRSTEFGPFSEQQRRAFIAELEKNGAVFGLEMTFPLASGTTKNALVFSRVLQQDGRPTVLTMLVDITQWKQAEKALQRALANTEAEKAKSDAILAALGEAVTIVDREYQVIYQNDRHRELFGDQIGRTCYQALDHGQEVCADCPIARTFTDGAVHRVERQLENEQDTVFLEITASPLRDNDGTIIGGVELVRDVSQRRRLEEILSQQEKIESIGVLAGGIAHDFNNLLTAVLGNISLCRLYAPDNAKLIAKLDGMEKACNQAQRLTHQLLTFSKGGAPVKRPLVLAELINETVSFSLRDAKVELSRDLPADLWPVSADRGQLAQVLHNLLLNATQAMPGGGTIVLAAKNIAVGGQNGLPLGQGNYVKLRVTDHGVGISPEHLGRIFDPYFSTKEKGSGLGLAVSYSVIKNHGGLLTVESQEGSGTTFYLYLPAADQGRLQDAALPEPLHYGSQPILIMDDEEYIQQLATDMLHQLGYQATTTAHGEEAVTRYREALTTDAPFAAVIMDLTIPGGMGGRETLVRLREIDPQVRAIVASGYANDPIMADFRRYGFHGCLAKPFTLKQLSQALHTVLQTP